MSEREKSVGEWGVCVSEESKVRYVVRDLYKCVQYLGCWVVGYTSVMNLNAEEGAMG